MNENKLSNVTKEELEKLIFEEKLSYEEIGRRYEVSGNAIKKRARKLGIELPKKRDINSSETFNKGIFKKEKFICKNCGKEFTPKQKRRNIVVMIVVLMINLIKNMKTI